MINDLIDWFYGRLTTSGRIYSALWPAFVISGYFVAGMCAYLLRVRLKGPYRDAEMERRGETLLANMWIRQWFAWVMRPIWGFLRWTKVPADALTTLSVMLAIAGGAAIAVGRFSLGGWLYIFAGVCDFFDGRIARETGTAGPRGSALDSVLDRYADGAILIGLGWYYRDQWVLFATMVALVGSMMVPYVRAKGESLGVAVTGGIAQRAERIVYLGITVALSPIMEAVLVPHDPHPPHRLAIAGIVLMAISTQVTVLQRLYFLLKALNNGKPRLDLGLGRGGVVRNAVAGGAATAVDFAVVVALVGSLGLIPWQATAVGCAVGAVVNFTMNRAWTFNSNGAMMTQAGRFAFVSASSLLLNSGGVAVIDALPGIDYRVAWWLVRVAVFVAWNYPLHRDYVFGHVVEPETRV